MVHKTVKSTHQLSLSFCLSFLTEITLQIWLSFHPKTLRRLFNIIQLIFEFVPNHLVLQQKSSSKQLTLELVKELDR